MNVINPERLLKVHTFRGVYIRTVSVRILTGVENSVTSFADAENVGVTLARHTGLVAMLRV